MKVSVDRDLCEAHGECVRQCAAVFEVDDEDELHILMEEVPAEHEEAVRRAVQRCPRQALSLSEE